jgi:chromosome transmission fidelity protein 18
MSLRATTFDGKTIYMKRKTRIEGLRNVSASQYSGGYCCPYSYQKSGTSGHRMGNLLDVPIHRLMDELSAATAAKLAHP